jgi:hypothetical protein
LWWRWRTWATTAATVAASSVGGATRTCGGSPALRTLVLATVLTFVSGEEPVGDVEDRAGDAIPMVRCSTLPLI